MEYRSIQYQVVQTANPTGFKWTVQLDAARTRTGLSHSVKSAVQDAHKKIDRALKEKKAE
jgi:dsRNA-specific ribonuclease